MSDNLSLLINALTVTAGFSLVVERSLEGMKHLLDVAYTRSQDDSGDIRSVISQRRDEVRNLTEAVRQATQGKTPPQPPSIEPALDSLDESEHLQRRRVKVAQAPSLQKEQSAYRLFLSLLAVGAGIVLAELANVHLLTLFLNKPVPHLLDVILTGIVIGGGSHSVHELLRFLTTRRAPTVSLGPTAQPESEPPFPGQGHTPQRALHKHDLWQPIPYRGGVKPETLEHRNLRDSDPNLIVYHHTAMHSNTPFQAVVDEFLVEKKWSTGYHCVIMPDGGIEAFCRWDRCGNHTKGVNTRSLGLAFHGNFHTQFGDSYANHDGRFGLQRPTEVQLDAGARVIALWMHLYGITMDFATSVMPHKSVIEGHTVCPGSNFPHEELRQRIAFYQTAWQNSPSIGEQLRAFAVMPYLGTVTPEVSHG